MKQQQDYIRDISEIRSMMERSTKFLSLSGWAGIMAGVYALAGAYIAYAVFDFSPRKVVYNPLGRMHINKDFIGLMLVAAAVLLLAIGTAWFFSNQKAKKKNEKLWNATSKRLMINMGVPLVAGGLFVLILAAKGLIGLVAPATLIFYGLSLYIASRYTYEDVKILGLVQVMLGLIAALYIGYGLLFWAIGFGAGHIIYGIYIHYKYER